MSLQVWLPLNDNNFNNKGFSENIFTNKGATLDTAGKIGNCYSFDGNDRIYTTNYSDSNNIFTACIWFCPTLLDTNSRYLFAYNIAGATSQMPLGVLISNSKITFISGGTSKQSSPLLELNTWYHLALCCDGTTQKLFLNGNQIESYSCGTVTSATNLTLGARSAAATGAGDSASYYFQGKLNDFRLYDECLTPRQIKEISKGLMLHYKMDNLDIDDCSGYNYNATPAGTLTQTNTSAIYDKCITFGVSTAYITVPTFDYSALADSFTFSWWSKISSMNGKMVWGFKDGNKLNIYPTSNVFCCNTGDSAQNPYKNNGTSLRFAPYEGDWHHYVMVGDGTSNKLYIDGEYAATATTYKGITGTQLFISGWSNATTQYRWVNGSISDFRLYATVLSDNDIKDLYNLKAYIDKKGNLYNYKFIENINSSTGFNLNKNGIINIDEFESKEDLPKEYKKLEYIESTGTQYINTNYKPYKTITEIKFQYPTIPSTNGVTLCGVYNENNNRYYALYYSTTNGICCSNRSNTLISLQNPGDNNIHTLLYNDTNNKVFFDGTLKGTVSNLTTESTYPLYLFARRGSNSAEVLSTGRIYYCKIWEENILVRNFIPALRISDQEPGLYDLVTKTFFTNAGTGKFLTNLSYKQIEYIESTGTQYINTGIVPTTETKIVCEYSDFTTAETYATPFGSRSTTSANQYWYYWTRSNNKLIARWQGSQYNCSYIYSNGERVKISYSKDGLYVNDTLTTSTFPTSSEFTSTYPIWLFTLNNKGATQYAASMKLYYCKIYQNNVLVKNFVPVKDKNNIVCLYDKITKTFYYNEGTGDFTAGPEIQHYTPLEYLESSGTQYIDTGIKPISNKTKIICDGTYLVANSGYFAGIYSNIYYGLRRESDTSMKWHNSGSATFTYDDFLNKRHIYGYDANKCYIDGILKSTLTMASTTGSVNLTLFCRNRGSSKDNYASFRMYSFQMYDETTLQRDYIPVLDKDNIPCLYDKVTKTFYYNEGTGDFSYELKDTRNSIEIYRNKIIANDFIEI